MKKTIRRAVCALLSAAILTGMCACGNGGGSKRKTYALSAGTSDLMANVEPSPDALSFGKDSGQERRFEEAYSMFAVRLFRECALKDNSGENTLVSPLSVMTALAMTANGAKGSTLAGMTDALSGGTAALTMQELNRYLGAYIAGLPAEEKARLTSANSIWVKAGAIDVRKEFLQTNADYYGADVFSAEFDGDTVKDINKWVSEGTDGMIPKLLDEISANAVMYLINALSFDAEWKEIYRDYNVHNGEFTDIDGNTTSVPMMFSEETRYLDDGRATGFVKPYASGYSFVAMLPNEGISLNDYISGMDLVNILAQVRAGEEENVFVTMPKFSAEYSSELSGVLSGMGMSEAFISGKADFSGMADAPADLYIGRVLHKTDRKSVV